MIKSANGAALEAIGDFIKRNPYLLAGGGLGAILGGLGGYNMVDETGNEEEDSSARLTGGLAGGLAGLLAGVTAGYIADGSGEAPQGAGNVVPEKQDATTGNGGDAAGNEGGLSVAQRAARYAYETTSNASAGQHIIGGLTGGGLGVGGALLRNKQLEKQRAGAETAKRKADAEVRNFQRVTGVTDPAQMRKITYDGTSGGDLLDTQKALKQNAAELKAKTTPHANKVRAARNLGIGMAAGAVAEPYVEDIGRRVARAFHNWIFPSNQ